MGGRVGTREKHQDGIGGQLLATDDVPTTLWVEGVSEHRGRHLLRPARRLSQGRHELFTPPHHVLHGRGRGEPRLDLLGRQDVAEHELVQQVADARKVPEERHDGGELVQVDHHAGSEEGGVQQTQVHLVTVIHRHVAGEASKRHVQIDGCPSSRELVQSFQKPVKFFVYQRLQTFDGTSGKGLDEQIPMGLCDTTVGDVQERTFALWSIVELSRSMEIRIWFEYTLRKGRESRVSPKDQEKGRYRSSHVR